MPPWPLDLNELGAGPDANQEAKGQHQPPQPGVLIPDKLSVPFHDQSPLGEREAEPGKGPVPRGDRVAEAHQQKEADPVKQEGRQEGGEECKVGAQQGNVLIKKSLSIIPLSPPKIIVNGLVKTSQIVKMFSLCTTDPSAVTRERRVHLIRFLSQKFLWQSFS